MSHNFTFYHRFIIVLLILKGISAYAGDNLPVPDHIVIAICENHAYSQIIGSSAAPHINALANDANAALFTNAYAIEHPSQPNYLDLYSGCNQGVTDDNLPASIPFTTANLGWQLLNAGKTFITFSEDLPSVGYNGETSGNYARKHNPASNWMGTGTNQIPSTTDQPFTAFPVADFDSLPTVSIVIPNLNDDMHNGTDPSTITAGDTWIYNNLWPYIQWAKTHNSLFILTFDEDDDNHNNQITTIFLGQSVKGGQYANMINHYSVLRTIEDIYGLTYICNAVTATSISNIWNPTATVNYNTDNTLSFYPNPVTDKLIVNGYSLTGKALINIYNVLGEKTSPPAPLHFERGDGFIDVAYLPPGIYFVQLIEEKEQWFGKFIKE